MIPVENNTKQISSSWSLLKRVALKKVSKTLPVSLPGLVWVKMSLSRSFFLKP